MTSRLVIAAAFVAATVGSGAARADVPGPAAPIPSASSAAQETAIAAALFEEGRRLMEAARFAEACARFAESQRLDPGGGTLLNLALCREREGKLATAHATYADALASARRDRREDRIEVCKQKLDELATRLPRLRIVVPRDTADGTPSLVVRVNDAILPPIAWGSEVPVDPGVVTIVAEAPGRVPAVARIVLAEAAEATQVISVAGLAPLADAMPPTAPRRGDPDRPEEVASASKREAGDGAVNATDGRPLVMVRGDLDGNLRGVVGYAGLGLGVGRYLELGGGALLGTASGAETGVRLFWPQPSALFRPFANVAVPLFVRDDKPFLGVRAALGLELVLHRHVALLVQAGGAFFPEAPEAVDALTFVPATGIVARL